MRIIISGSNSSLMIGDDTILKNGLIEIRADLSSIDIGSNVIFNGFIRLISEKTHVLIGDATTTMGINISLHEPGRIEIGKDCMFSGEINMDVSDIHSILCSSTMLRINPPGDIIIGDHVWIGSGVRILKGNKIGSDSVLGAKSLITKSVPSNCIVGGVPARVIKTGITWDRRLLGFEESLNGN